MTAERGGRVSATWPFSTVMFAIVPRRSVSTAPFSTRVPPILHDARRRLRVVVEGDENRFPRRGPREGVLLLGDVQLLQRAATQRFELVPQMNDAPQVIEHVLLLRRSTGRGERVARVARESARHAPAVVRIARARNRDLVPVVDLRNAARRHDERLRQLQPGGRRSRLVHEPQHVVVAEKHHEPGRVGIQVIASEHLRDFPYWLTLREGSADREEERKIEQRVDLGVYAVEAGGAAREKRHERGVAVVQLADGRELRVLALERLHPALPEGARHVRPRVLPDPVEAERTHPPQRVLDDVPGDLVIVLIQVGQDVDEPSIERVALRLGRRMRILQCPGLPCVGDVLRFGAVEPCRRRRVGHPRVVRTRVVRDLVLNHLDAKPLGRLHEGQEIGHRAKVLLDPIEVHGAVAVIVGNREVVVLLFLIQVVDVVVPRVQPESRDAQVLQVRQLLADAGKVAAVVIAALGSIEQARRGRRVVVGRVAVPEPVWHQQVNDIVRGEPLKPSGARKRSRDLERSIRGAGRRGDAQPASARRRGRINRHVDEQVRARRIDTDEADGEPIPDGVDASALQASAVDQNANRVPRVTGPPVRRFDFADAWLGRGQTRSRQERKKSGRKQRAPGLHGGWERYCFTNAPLASTVAGCPPARFAADPP